MLKGIDLSQRIEFSSKEDKGDQKTIFVIRPLSGVEMLDVAKHVDNGQLRLTKEYVMDVLGMTIVEVKNPSKKTNDEIKEFVSSLTPSIIMELVTEAGNINKFSGEEEKNS